MSDFHKAAFCLFCNFALWAIPKVASVGIGLHQLIMAAQLGAALAMVLFLTRSPHLGNKRN